MYTLRQSTVVAVLFYLTFSVNIFAQDIPEYELEKVIVTAGRTPQNLSESSKNITILEKEEIEKLPVVSIQNLLQYVSGVDLRQRGVNGTQADAGIRGGTFEQTLIMIDGVKMSDPQTGHHNLNLPVSLDQIERVEIIKGQGSKIFGPNAFSGAINFITKKTRDNRIDFSLSGGSYNSFEISAHGAYSINKFSGNLTITKQKADGYITNTNYDLKNISYNSLYSFSGGVINFLAGYSDQKFGANSFYSLKYPNQWEAVKTKIISLSGEFGNDIVSISPKFSWRNKQDEFLLDHTNPNFYRNIHETNSYGFEMQLSVKTELGTFSFGGELTKDNIISKNLGDNRRENKGLFFEYLFSPIQKLKISSGAYLFSYSGMGWKLWPGIDAAFQASENVKLFASFGKSFRIPSYTELYYSDPVTVGNANLESEETVNYETGISFINHLVKIEANIFHKKGKNIIDWIKTSNEDVWHAENITEINTSGIELSLKLSPGELLSTKFLKTLSIDYTYLDSDKSSRDYNSRYLLDHLRHQLITRLEIVYFDFVNHSIQFRYEDRNEFGKHFLTDTQLSKNVFRGRLFINVTNVFDLEYHDISGVVLPGRWITAGYKINLLEL